MVLGFLLGFFASSSLNTGAAGRANCTSFLVIDDEEESILMMMMLMTMKMEFEHKNNSRKLRSEAREKKSCDWDHDEAIPANLSFILLLL